MMVYSTVQQFSANEDEIVRGWPTAPKLALIGYDMQMHGTVRFAGFSQKASESPAAVVGFFLRSECLTNPVDFDCDFYSFGVFLFFFFR